MASSKLLPAAVNDIAAFLLVFSLVSILELVTIKILTSEKTNKKHNYKIN